MTQVKRKSRLARMALPTLGALLIGFGTASVSYGSWAWIASRKFIAEVAASGQAVEALDSASFIMSSGGIYVLVGLLLLAHGGLYFIVSRIRSQHALPHQESDNTPSSPQPVEDDNDLEDLLDDLRV